MTCLYPYDYYQVRRRDTTVCRHKLSAYFSTLIIYVVPHIIPSSPFFNPFNPSLILRPFFIAPQTPRSFTPLLTPLLRLALRSSFSHHALLSPQPNLHQSSPPHLPILKPPTVVKPPSQTPISYPHATPSRLISLHPLPPPFPLNPETPSWVFLLRPCIVSNAVPRREASFAADNYGRGYSCPLLGIFLERQEGRRGERGGGLV